MPGFTLLWAPDGDRENLLHEFERCINETQAGENEEAAVLWREGPALLGCTAYAEYPRYSDDGAVWRVYFEGRVHNRERSEALGDLQGRLEALLDGKDGARSRLANWLLDADGEFVVILLHQPTQRLFVLNDVFARLPVYWCATERTLVLSRNIRPVRRLAGAREYDRLSMAHYLLWGYYTQPETYLKGVARLEPASLLRVDLRDGSRALDTLHIFNFDEKQQPELSVKDNATELATLFVESCRNRAAPDATNLLSLSGGLDSRTVAAGLHRSAATFRTSSFIDFERARTFDFEVAGQLAALFRVPRAVFELKPPTGADALRALRLKNGFNYFGTSFLMQYFEALRTEYGAGIRYFSGNGGDRMAQYFRPNIDFQQIEQVVQYLVNRRRLFTLDEIGAITRTDRQEILDSVVELLRSFPERDLNQKFIHAELYGDGLSRHLEGEDRIRSFFWTASPFWSVPFFRHIMRIPDRQKRMFGLYKRFLECLSPAAAAIVYPNVNARICSMRHRLFVLSKDLRWFLSRFRKRTVQHTHSPDLLRCFLNQLTDCEAIGDWLSVPAIHTVLERAAMYKHEAIETLFTMTSIMEDLETGRSSMEEFRTAPFSVPSDSWEWFKHRPFRTSG